MGSYYGVHVDLVLSADTPADVLSFFEPLAISATDTWNYSVKLPVPDTAPDVLKDGCGFYLHHTTYWENWNIHPFSQRTDGKYVIKIQGSSRYAGVEEYLELFKWITQWIDVETPQFFATVNYEDCGYPTVWEYDNGRLRRLELEMFECLVLNDDEIDPSDPNFLAELVRTHEHKYLD